MLYNNLAAVDYAKKYALTPNKNYMFFDYFSNNVGGDCTNFLSQCLYAGSAQMVYYPNSWYYKRLINPPYYNCSFSWSVAHSLYWFLKNNDKIRAAGPKGHETTPNNIALGDLIFFENLNHHIFHGAIVTDFTSDGKPLLSQHTSNALNIPIKPNYYNLIIHYLNIYL